MVSTPVTRTFPPERLSPPLPLRSPALPQTPTGPGPMSPTPRGRVWSMFRAAHQASTSPSMGHPPAVPVPDACSQYLVFVDTPECRDPAFDECPRWGMPSFTCDLPGAVEAGELAGGTQLSPVLRGLSAGTQSLLRSHFRAPPRCAGHGAGNICAAREPRRAPRRHGAHVRRPPVRGARVTAGSPDTAPSGTAVRVKLGRHRPACPSTCATSASGPTGLTCPHLPSPALACPHLSSPASRPSHSPHRGSPDSLC